MTERRASPSRRFVHMLPSSLTAEPESKEGGRCREPASDQSPTTTPQEVSLILAPPACLLLPLFLGKGIQVAVFILDPIALNSLMPSAALELIHQRPIKAPAETFGLDAALILWYGHNISGMGGKLRMHEIPRIRFEVGNGGTTVMGCFQS